MCKKEKQIDYLIVNYWDTLYNYGACLTAYAMQEFLTDLGFVTKILDTGERSRDNRYNNSLGGKFAKQFLRTTGVLKFRQANELTKNIKGVILGSDQVLRLQYTNKNYCKYLLNFVDKKCKKIALAPSFGLDKADFLADKFSKRRNIKMMKQAFQSFDYLSCREISGKEIYKDVFNLNSDMILDPVFLVDKAKYENIIVNSQNNYSGKIINYILDKDENQSGVFDYLSGKLGTEVLSLNRMTGDTSVADWLKAIKDCELFVTDSFHGACFAILFNKPFYCLKNKDRGSARFDSLIELFGIEENFVSSLDEIKNKNLDLSYDWIRINSILDNERERCIKILKKVLFEDYSNNKKRASKIKCLHMLKKINLKIKIFREIIYILLDRSGKNKHIQKIYNIKHLIEWGC